MPSLLNLKDKVFYGWVVVAALFIVSITFGGIYFSFGIFFKSIETEFHLTRANTSAISSVYMVLAALFAILGGWAMDRYGPRVVLFVMGLFTGLSLVLTGQVGSAWQLFLNYSLLLAVGTGAMYVVTMSTVLRWFNRKRGLAAGITGSGGGLGMMVMAPFATYLISSFDWRMAYVVIGVIAWVLVIPLARVVRKEPAEIGALPDGVKTMTGERSGQGLEAEQEVAASSVLSPLQTMRTRSFWLFVTLWFLLAVSMLLITTHIVPHATDLGIEEERAATILSIIGGTSVVGMVLMGIAADRIGRKQAAIICFLGQGVAILWLMWAQELWALYLFAIVFGFANGGIHPATTALIGDTFGLLRIGLVLGLLEIGWAMGAAVGPVMGGYIFDTRGSYFLALLIGVVAMVVAGFLVLLVRRES